jgi:hypothetical protein
MLRWRGRATHVSAPESYPFDADYGARRTFEFRTKRRCIGSPSSTFPSPTATAKPAGDPNPGSSQKKQRVDRMESNPGL